VLCFASNGDVLVSRRQPGGVVEVSRVNLTTGARTLVRQITPWPGSLSMGGVGSLIVTPDGRGYLYSYGVNEASLFLVSNLK
jgi:hypothetical protein